MASMDAQGGGDEEASVAAWLRRENTNLLKKNRQLKQELKQAETAATGGVDVEALRQKLTTQTREIERLESEVAEGAGAVAELAAARVRVVELQTRLDEAEAENEAREAERETVLAAAQQAGQASSDGQAEAVAAAAEFKAKAKAAVKQQKAKLKEQAQAIESMTGSLATAKAEAASSAKTLKALRAEYKLVDQQREEQGRRAAEAEQKRASAVGQEAAALAKLQQGTEGWQQQRLKAQAKYTQLKEGYKEKLQAAKAYTQQQHEELEALRAAAAAAGGGGAGAHEPGPDELRTSGSPSAPQALIDGFTVPPDAPPAAAAAAASQLPVAVAVAADAEDDEDDEEDGELFGEDLEQEYKLAQGGVQEYIFQLEQERREEREEMDFQIGEYIQRIANLEDEAQRAGRAAAAGVGGGARPVVHAVGQVISTGGAGAGRQGIGGQGMPVGTVAGASGQGAAAAAAAAAVRSSTATLNPSALCLRHPLRRTPATAPPPGPAWRCSAESSPPPGQGQACVNALTAGGLAERSRSSSKLWAARRLRPRRRWRWRVVTRNGRLICSSVGPRRWRQRRRPPPPARRASGQVRIAPASAAIAQAAPSAHCAFPPGCPRRQPLCQSAALCHELERNGQLRRLHEKEETARLTCSVRRRAAATVEPIGRAAGLRRRDVHGPPRFVSRGSHLLPYSSHSNRRLCVF